MFRKKRKDNIDGAALVASSGLKHIAFIMDGNGRWATKRGLPREAGHSAGAANMKKVVRYCRSINIPNCTIYAFSTENWNRPDKEVNALMTLFKDYLVEALEEVDVEFHFIGTRKGINEELSKEFDLVEEITKGREYKLYIALNYGGREEIVHAVNKLIDEGKRSVTEDDISANLYAPGCPEPDLVVRTGGEYRTSNFLLWQSAYSEYYFTDKLWPDYSSDDVDEAVLAFSKRKRRFGGLDKK